MIKGKYTPSTLKIIEMAKRPGGIGGDTLPEGIEARSLWRAAWAGHVFTLKGGSKKVKRLYFDTQERADAYYKENPRPAKIKHSKKPKVTKLAQPKPVNREKVAREKWAKQEAHRPAHVEVQDCPGYTGVSRFAAEPGSHGAGFVSEWKSLRSAA